VAAVTSEINKSVLVENLIAGHKIILDVFIKYQDAKKKLI
jgi:hypothetical protein